jgi:hypothetical protein
MGETKLAQYIKRSKDREAGLPFVSFGRNAQGRRDAESRYLTMAAPAEIRRAIAKSSPHLESLYYSSRMQAANLGPNEADNIIACYPGAVGTTFPGQNEEQVKRVITPTYVRELGIRAEGEVLDVLDNERWSNSDVVRRRAPYVAVMRNGKLEGVIDRAEFVSQIANELLSV